MQGKSTDQNEHGLADTITRTCHFFGKGQKRDRCAMVLCISIHSQIYVPMFAQLEHLQAARLVSQTNTSTLMNELHGWMWAASSTPIRCEIVESTCIPKRGDVATVEKCR